MIPYLSLANSITCSINQHIFSYENHLAITHHEPSLRQLSSISTKEITEKKWRIDIV